MITPEYYYVCKYYPKEILGDNISDFFTLYLLLEGVVPVNCNADNKIEEITGKKIQEIENVLKDKSSINRNDIFKFEKNKNAFHIKRIKECNEKDKKKKKKLKESFSTEILLNDWVKLSDIKHYQSAGFLKFSDLCSDSELRYFINSGERKILKELSICDDNFKNNLINVMLAQVNMLNVHPESFPEYCKNYKEVLFYLYDKSEIEKIIEILPLFKVRNLELKFHDKDFKKSLTQDYNSIDMNLFKTMFCCDLEKTLIESSIAKDDLILKKRKRM